MTPGPFTWGDITTWGDTPAVGTTGDLVMRVRRRLGELPRFVRVVGATDDTTNPVVLTLAPGNGAAFPQPGGQVEWDDGTGETGTVVSLPDTDKIEVLRSNFGEPMATHGNQARLLLAPRFGYLVLSDLITDIVDELWPFIWVPRETTLAYQSTNDYYSPTVDDVAEVLYAYQLAGGRRWPLAATFLPTKLADDTNFPNGAITIPLSADSSTIYVAYKAIPTIANLLGRQRPLVVDGVIAKATMDEEARHVSPASSSTQRRVADGAKLKAGAALWQLFEERLERERMRLLSEDIQGARLWSP